MSDPRQDFLTGKPLAPYYDAIAMPTDRQYGIDSGLEDERGLAINAWLPFTTNRIGSASWVDRGVDPQWSMPQVFRDGLRGWLDLLGAKDTGTPQALGAFLSGSVGAGMAATPRGALAAGGGRIGVPMDTVGSLAMDAASRLARARKLGFEVDTPVFHGTNRPIIPGFALNPENRATTTLSARETTWAAENPEVARLHAELAAQAAGTTGQNILPLFFRADRKAIARLEGSEADHEVATTIWDLFRSGYDAVKFENYPSTIGGRSGENIWAFKNPNQLRSWFARFDPTKRDSSDLMAGVALPGVAPAPGFRVEAEPKPPNGDTQSAWPNGASFRPFRSKPVGSNWPIGTPYRIRSDMAKDMVY